MRWRPSQTTLLVFSGAVTVMVGLSGSLATNTVSAMPPWWKPVVWSLLVSLILLFLVLAGMIMGDNADRSAAAAEVELSPRGQQVLGPAAGERDVDVALSLGIGVRTARG
jgi:protein-S-isoprenylcysteine O-methyltransferase Ste14